MAELTIDTRAFIAGLASALREMRDGDGEDYLRTAAEAALNVAEARVKRRSGAVADGLGMRSGEGWVDVGVISPPPDRHDFYLEFGTYKDAAQPFMRPALAAVASGIAAAGGQARRRSSVTSRGVAARARKRAIIRGAVRAGTLSSGEAQALSGLVWGRRRRRRRRR